MDQYAILNELRVLCAYPLTLWLDGDRRKVVPCGQCMGCRINTRRKKAARFLLERLGHEKATFATLTIDDDHLDPSESVWPRDLQLFMKRLRKQVGPTRFVAVGEYGERTRRPHYHALLYGHSALELEPVLATTWTKGHTDAQEWGHEANVASYVAGYVTKKMTKPDDPRLEGRNPEFMRQSLRPAIGMHGLPILEQLEYTRGGSRDLAITHDVAKTFRVDGKVWPLDRTMRMHLRDRVGLPKADFQRGRGMDPLSEEEEAVAISRDSKLERRSTRRTRVF